MSRSHFVVMFYHRGGWQEYAELGPTMMDVAIQRAKELSIPFRDAQVRWIEVPHNKPWQQGTMLALREYRNGEMISHHDLVGGSNA